MKTESCGVVALARIENPIRENDEPGNDFCLFFKILRFHGTQNIYGVSLLRNHLQRYSVRNLRTFLLKHLQSYFDFPW